MLDLLHETTCINQQHSLWSANILKTERSRLIFLIALHSTHVLKHWILMNKAGPHFAKIKTRFFKTSNFARLGQYSESQLLATTDYNISQIQITVFKRENVIFFSIYSNMCFGCPIYSDFISPFLTPHMGVVPNPKMAFIFTISCILVRIFPIFMIYFPNCEGKGSFPKS